MEKTPKAEIAIGFAKEYALDAGHNFVGIEDVVLGILKVRSSLAAKALLKSLNKETEANISSAISLWANQESGHQEEFESLLSAAEEEAARLNHDYVGPEHLLLAITCCAKGGAVLTDLGVEASSLRDLVLRMLGETALEFRDCAEH